MATEREIAGVLGVLSATYPTFELREQTVEVYCQLLADVPLEALRAAAKQHIAGCRFFPTVSELRGLARRIRNGLARRPTALEAWQEVKEHMLRGDLRVRPEFSNPITDRVIRSMGWWYNLCLSENGMADRAHFLRAYDELAQREEEDALLLPEVRALAARLSSPALPEPEGDPDVS